MNKPINKVGPSCAWCACRPDDPMWIQPVDQQKDLACLGCVADLRALGQSVRVLGRAIFARDEAMA